MLVCRIRILTKMDRICNTGLQECFVQGSSTMALMEKELEELRGKLEEAEKKAAAAEQVSDRLRINYILSI